MNIDYSQFYRGTTNIPSYGNGIGSPKFSGVSQSFLGAISRDRR